jgi:hypothetical protein
MPQGQPRNNLVQSSYIPGNTYGTTSGTNSHRVIAQPHTTTHLSAATQPNIYQSQMINQPMSTRGAPNGNSRVVSETRGEPRMIQSQMASQPRSEPRMIQSQMASQPRMIQSQMASQPSRPQASQMGTIQRSPARTYQPPTTTQSQYIPQNIAGFDIGNLDTFLNGLVQTTENRNLTTQLNSLEVELKKKAIETEIYHKNREH